MATEDEIVELRRRIAERIKDPAADPTGALTTAFSNDEIDALIEAAKLTNPDDYMERAAYDGWMLKAGWALEGKVILIESSIGSEKMKFATPQDRYKHAIEMAKFWQLRFVGSADVGVVLEQEPDPVVIPEVVYTTEDISRLMGVDD